MVVTGRGHTAVREEQVGAQSLSIFRWIDQLPWVAWDHGVSVLTLRKSGMR